MVERLYTVPLRRDWLKTPKWRRSKKAISTVKTFLARHTKAKTIKLSRWVNEEVWAKGAKNPPGKITLKVDINKEKSIVKAELAELPAAVKRKLERKKEEEEKAKKVEAKKPKPEETPETKEKEAKEEEKTPAIMTQQQEMAMHKK